MPDMTTKNIRRASKDAVVLWEWVQRLREFHALVKDDALRWVCAIRFIFTRSNRGEEPNLPRVQESQSESEAESDRESEEQQETTSEAPESTKANEEGSESEAEQQSDESKSLVALQAEYDS